jgi:putative transposase
MAGNAALWRDMPEVFGKWTGVRARFRRWSRAGICKKLFHAMVDLPDFEYIMVDSTISKVHADASGAKEPVLSMSKQGLKLPQSVAPAAG